MILIKQKQHDVNMNLTNMSCWISLVETWCYLSINTHIMYLHQIQSNQTSRQSSATSLNEQLLSCCLKYTVPWIGTFCDYSYTKLLFFLFNLNHKIHRCLTSSKRQCTRQNWDKCVENQLRSCTTITPPPPTPPPTSPPTHPKKHKDGCQRNKTWQMYSTEERRMVETLWWALRKTQQNWVWWRLLLRLYVPRSSFT